MSHSTHNEVISETNCQSLALVLTSKHITIQKRTNPNKNYTELDKHLLTCMPFMKVFDLNLLTSKSNQSGLLKWWRSVARYTKNLRTI